ncbi:hypothetical protein RJT34_02715 [Clitoria ternatea]|uniref:Fe2OG dioxygenase domain-containing protein n=1 Tax=Clitoria ternatea TaxID=43366 RepID=A0AAN9Q429_CLITE
MAKYPQCPRPELVRGLREHTDAGDIILLLQDDKVSGLEFFKDGKWVEIPPSKKNAIFVNTCDQVEVLSNAPKLLYHFGDYLKLYGNTKFGEKGPRFESMKNMINGHKNILA